MLQTFEARSQRYCIEELQSPCGGIGDSDMKRNSIEEIRKLKFQSPHGGIGASDIAIDSERMLTPVAFQSPYGGRGRSDCT